MFDMIKTKSLFIGSKIKNGLRGNKKTLAFSTALSIPCLTFAADGGKLINTTGVNFMDVLNEMVALVPVVLPVIVGCLAFRKGFSFIKNAIKGA